MKHTFTDVVDRVERGGGGGRDERLVTTWGGYEFRLPMPCPDLGDTIEVAVSWGAD